MNQMSDANNDQNEFPFTQYSVSYTMLFFSFSFLQSIFRLSVTKHWLFLLVCIINKFESNQNSLKHLFNKVLFNISVQDI